MSTEFQESGTGVGTLFFWEKNSLRSDTFSWQKKYPSPLPVHSYCGPPFAFRFIFQDWLLPYCLSSSDLFGNDQSTVGSPFCCNHSFAREKCLQPKKPR